VAHLATSEPGDRESILTKISRTWKNGDRTNTDNRPSRPIPRPAARRRSDPPASPEPVRTGLARAPVRLGRSAESARAPPALSGRRRNRPQSPPARDRPRAGDASGSDGRRTDGSGLRIARGIGGQPRGKPEATPNAILDEGLQGDGTSMNITNREDSLDGCFSRAGVTKGDGSLRPSLRRQRPNSTSRPGLRSEPNRNDSGGRPIRTRSTST
jgi:hypothetical protein